MTTPVSLRIARLLLVAAAAAAFGVFAYIAVLARSFSVPLVVFLIACAAFVLAARSLGTDLRRARLIGGGSSTASESSVSTRATVSGSGGAGPSASSGEIHRGDGVVIRYRCSGSEVVEFTIERP